MTAKEVIASVSMLDGAIENLDGQDAVAIIAKLDEAGYVIVPRLPTNEMIRAALLYMDSYSTNLAWWDAMLRAAQ